MSRMTRGNLSLQNNSVLCPLVQTTLTDFSDLERSTVSVSIVKPDAPSECAFQNAVLLCAHKLWCLFQVFNTDQPVSDKSGRVIPDEVRSSERVLMLHGCVSTKFLMPCYFYRIISIS